MIEFLIYAFGINECLGMLAFMGGVADGNNPIKQVSAFVKRMKLVEIANFRGETYVCYASSDYSVAYWKYYRNWPCLHIVMGSPWNTKVKLLPDGKIGDHPGNWLESWRKVQ